MFAHSADAKRGIPPQYYTAHVGGVVDRAFKAAIGAAEYAACDGPALVESVSLAAEYHDLGKLDAENQEVLSGEVRAATLPVQHTDAGTAHLLNALQRSLGAALIRSHHIGLPDFVEEQNRDEESVFRDDNVRERVNRSLPELIELHRQAFGPDGTMHEPEGSVAGDVSLFLRIALSCLADGDHTDTAVHYGDQTDFETTISLRPAERLAALDRFVGTLEENNDRSRLRSEVYAACRSAEIDDAIASCDSPVGTGKTTAIIAHLLAQAVKGHLRRIIVVLPFTNIIRQSVEIYRKALVLPGENPEHVVAELHHRADFQDVHSRQFTGLWKSPIIVTTAVAFFETLASNRPATLRRLHNLPGSAVFIDESHAVLPAKLLPTAWRWIKGFGVEWGCYWVLASGSLNRFWKIEEFDRSQPDVPEIMPPILHDRLMEYEKGRIEYRFLTTPLGVAELVELGGLPSRPAHRDREHGSERRGNCERL